MLIKYAAKRIGQRWTMVITINVLYNTKKNQQHTHIRGERWSVRALKDSELIAPRTDKGFFLSVSKKLMDIIGVVSCCLNNIIPSIQGIFPSSRFAKTSTILSIHFLFSEWCSLWWCVVFLRYDTLRQLNYSILCRWKKAHLCSSMSFQTPSIL